MKSRAAIVIGLLLCATAVGAILFVVQSGPSGSMVARAEGDEGAAANAPTVAQNGQPGEGEEEQPPPKVLPSVVSEPRYASARPRYVWIVVTQDAKKVLPVVFDESQGTGAGYDVLYADFNFDRRIEPTEKHTAAANRGEGYSSANWKPIPLNVRYNDLAANAEQPSRLHFGYFRAQGWESFNLMAEMWLAQDSSAWQYVVYVALTPAARLFEAPVTRLNLPPEIRITAGPDDVRQGNTGIVVEAAMAGGIVNATAGDGRRLSATVVVRNAGGRAVIQKTGAMGEFGFG